MARLDLEGAKIDSARAIELGAAVEGFEFAGWVAYYQRDFDTALRWAEEGVERAETGDARASCLALAGRIRHTRGELAEAAARFEEGVAIAPAAIRGMIQVWFGQLQAHRGRPEEAADLARRGLLDPHLSHPFVAGHGHFTLAYALGIAGRWAEALGVVDQMDAWIARQGDRRFPSVAANIRGWLLRGAASYEVAIDLHQPVVDGDPAAIPLQEARYAALLDLAECHLAAGSLDQAAAGVDRTADIVEWTGSMHWRHQNRYRLLAARISSLGGDHERAIGEARAVAAAAAERGDRRYQHRALITAATIAARAGEQIDAAEVARLVDGFMPLSGPDGWRDLGELAGATGSDDIWRRAEQQAATIVSQASGRAGVDADRVAASVRRELDRLRP